VVLTEGPSNTVSDVIYVLSGILYLYSTSSNGTSPAIPSGYSQVDYSEPTSGFISFNDLLITDCGISCGNSYLVQVSSIDTAAPLPAALPLFATGLGGLGLLGWRRKRKAVA
jgi:hypothetical protein